MKLALLSDIHGNHYALNAVLDAVKQQDVTTLLITGDFVGYYFWPVEVLELLENWDIVAVRGNHDKMLIKAREDENFLRKMTKKYGCGLSIALECLNDESLAWLMTLPDSIVHEVLNEKILLCHGSPWKDDEYVYPDSEEKSLNRYSCLDATYVVQGHTHYPMLKAVEGVTVINPGSVGQPRNGQPGAHWALLDTEQRNVKHFCEQYDTSSVIKESKIRNPDIPYLADILERV